MLQIFLMLSMDTGPARNQDSTASEIAGTINLSAGAVQLLLPNIMQRYDHCCSVARQTCGENRGDNLQT
jgi:hypothetical protein